MNNEINKMKDNKKSPNVADQSIEKDIEKKLKKTEPMKKIDQDKQKDDIYKKNLDELKSKLSETEDRVIRSLADIENLRKRHDRELDDLRKYSSKDFALSLLSVADNFERAMKSLPENTSEENEIFKNLIIGIKAIEKEFYDVFEKNGITAFSSKDKKFDPELHQAVSQIESEIEEGKIVEELQRGFKIFDRLLRPSMVIVSKGVVVKDSIKDEKK